MKRFWYEPSEARELFTVASAASFTSDGSEGIRRHLPRFETFHVNGLLDLADLWQIVNLPGFKDLRDPPWTPGPAYPLTGCLSCT